MRMILIFPHASFCEDMSKKLRVFKRNKSKIEKITLMLSDLIRKDLKNRYFIFENIIHYIT